MSDIIKDIENNSIKDIEEYILTNKTSSKILAGYIITYRLLGIYKELSIKCMNVLNYRRSLGDDFEYEIYIEEEIKNSPKSNKININPIKQIIGQ
jgi:hypothetical protein